MLINLLTMHSSFPENFWEISKNADAYRTPLMAASAHAFVTL